MPFRAGGGLGEAGWPRENFGGKEGDKPRGYAPGGGFAKKLAHKLHTKLQIFSTGMLTHHYGIT